MNAARRFLFQNYDFVIARASPDDVIARGSLYVEDGEIKAIGRAEDVEQTVGDAAGVDIIDGRGKLLMPGLVDAHAHIGDWCSQICYNALDYDQIQEVDQVLDVYFWPAWAWYSAEAAYDLTLFGLAHMLERGTTCSSNNYLWAEPTVRALADSGARGINHSNLLTIIQRKDARDGHDQLAKIEETIQEYHQADGRVQVGIGPDTPFNVKAEVLVKGMELAERYDLSYGIHVAEAREEVERADRLWADDGGYLQHLRALDLLTPRTLMWQAIALDHDAIDMLADLDVAIGHCPLRCADFRCNTEVAYMLKKGMRVGLGTDHASHNLFRAMWGCRLMQDASDREHHLPQPWTPLELATLGSARALRLDHHIGTLEVGKRADLITYDLSRESGFFPHMEATIIMGLVMQGPTGTTNDVMVDGRFLRRDGEFTELDRERIWAQATRWIDEFKGYYYSGLEAGTAMVVRNHRDYMDL